MARAMPPSARMMSFLRLVRSAHTPANSDTLPQFTAFIDPNTPLAFGQTQLAYSLYLTDYTGSGTPPAGTYTIGFNVDPNAELNRNYNIYVVNGTLTVTAPGGGGTTTDPGTEDTTTTTTTPGGPAPGGVAPVITPVAEPATPAAAPTAPAAVATEPDEAPEGASLVDLDGSEVPLAATAAQWALVNLLVAVLALVFAILMFATMFKRNKKRDETDDEKYARMEAEAALGEEPEETPRNKKSGLIWRILSILSGVLAPIVFLLTENMNNPMVFVDRWTLLMVVILAIQVISMLLVRYTRSREDKDDLEEQEANV